MSLLLTLTNYTWKYLIQELLTCLWGEGFIKCFWDTQKRKKICTCTKYSTNINRGKNIWTSALEQLQPLQHLPFLLKDNCFQCCYKENKQWSWNSITNFWVRIWIHLMLRVLTQGLRYSNHFPHTLPKCKNKGIITKIQQEIF